MGVTDYRLVAVRLNWVEMMEMRTGEMMFVAVVEADAVGVDGIRWGNVVADFGGDDDDDLGSLAIDHGVVDVIVVNVVPLDRFRLESGIVDYDDDGDDADDGDELMGTTGAGGEEAAGWNDWVWNGSNETVIHGEGKYVDGGGCAA